MLSRGSKVLLKNVIRHTDTHNRLVEEDEMWRQREKTQQHRHRSYRARTPATQDLQGAHMDRSPAPESTFWMRQFYEATEKDPSRWGHSGYRELYPDMFDERRSATDSDSSTEPSRVSSEKKKKHKKDKKKKKKHRKSKKAKRDRSHERTNKDNTVTHKSRNSHVDKHSRHSNSHSNGLNESKKKTDVKGQDESEISSHSEHDESFSDYKQNSRTNKKHRKRKLSEPQDSEYKSKTYRSSDSKKVKRRHKTEHKVKKKRHRSKFDSRETSSDSDSD